MSSRREPAEVEGTAGAGLRVRVLGDLVIEGIDVRELRSRKARTALKVLAVRRGAFVPVDQLVDCLWPGTDLPAQPEREVAVNLSRARGLVGAERIERTDAGYRLVLDWLDLDVFEALAAEARRRLDAGDHTAAHTAAAGALALVRGPLLADEADAEWLDRERAAVARTVGSLRSTAAAAALHVGAPAEAAAQAEDALADDPYDEAAVRILMQAHVAAGRPGSALGAYATVRRRLAEDLGTGPTRETEALHREILLLDDGPDPAATATPVGPVLPGRRRELDELRSALDRSRHGLELLVVEGEAGAGKSRLLEAFAADAAGRGALVLTARCDELGRALPLQPLADALAGHLQAATDTGVLPEDQAALAPLLGLPAAAASAVPGPGMSTEAMQAFVFGALARVLRRLGTGRPTVLLLDDLHLAGTSTLGWLQFARRRGDELPVLVVGARRGDEGEPIAGAVRLPLDALDLAAVTEIVGAERAASVHARSGGNPLLVVELAATDDDLPDSIRELVAARLDRTGQAVAATIRTAAVLGPAIDLDLLATVLDRSPLDLLDDLEEGVRRQFLVERGSHFAFRHELVREAVEAGLSASRRVQVHRMAVAALAERPDADPLQLAHHARCGDEPRAAADALRAAAALAAARYDLGEAERLLDEAIALDDTAEGRLARARVRAARADLGGVEEDGLAAAGLGRRAEGLGLRAWAARHRHDMESALRLGTEGAALARASGDRDTEASCLLVTAFAHRGVGDLREADAEMDAALACGAEVDLGLRGWLGVLRVHQGRAHEAIDLLDPVLGTEIDVVHGFWVEHVLQMTAHAHAMRGRPAVALAILDRLRAEMRRRGSDIRYGGLDDNYRAWILTNLGDPRAEGFSAAAIDGRASPEVTIMGTLDAAVTAFHLGDHGGADALTRAAIDRSGIRWFNNRWRFAQRALFLQSLLAFEDGDVAAAHAHADELERAASSRGDARYATLAAVLVARARHREGAPVDRDRLDGDLRRLGDVAGMEAWWLTAATAADLHEDRWWTLAAQRVRDLCREAFETGAPDDHARADAFRAHAQSRFESLGHR